jgi:hypothetical protein
MRRRMTFEAVLEKMERLGMFDQAAAEEPVETEKRRKVPKKERPFCGAKCRDGHACNARVVPGKTKCRLHGGLSGAKTEAGKEKIREANRNRKFQRARQDAVQRNVAAFRAAVGVVLAGGTEEEAEAAARAIAQASR